MNRQELKKVLNEAYADLSPFSDKYRIDFDRYLFSLELITGIDGYKDKRMLDIGTSIGIMLLAAKKLGIKEVFGMERYIFPEIGNAMFGIDEISKLKSIWREHDVEVFNLDILGNNFPSEINNVDIILSEATIEHLQDPRLFLERIFKLLSSGGHLLITTPNLATMIKRLRFLVGKTPFWPIEDFYAEGARFTGHWREYTMNELEYMCKKSGYVVIGKYTKNNLGEFKSITNWRKNVKMFIAVLSSFIPSSREMHYILCRKS